MQTLGIAVAVGVAFWVFSTTPVSTSSRDYSVEQRLRGCA